MPSLPNNPISLEIVFAALKLPQAAPILSTRWRRVLTVLPRFAGKGLKGPSGGGFRAASAAMGCVKRSLRAVRAACLRWRGVKRVPMRMHRTTRDLPRGHVLF